MKLLLSLVLIISTNIFAKDNLAPHSHEKIELDVVVDSSDNKVIFAIEGAAMPVIGFEGDAKTPEQKEKLKKAKDLWTNAASWLSLLSNTDCKVASSSFENSLEDDDEDDHDHDHHGGSHSEIEAELVISCKDISKVKMTKFSFFKKVVDLKIVTEKVKEVEVSVIPNDGSAYKKEIKTIEFDLNL